MSASQVRQSPSVPLQLRLKSWLREAFVPHLLATVLLGVFATVSTRLFSADIYKVTVVIAAMLMILLLWLTYVLSTKARQQQEHFVTRSLAVHLFIHRARDLVVQLLSGVEQYGRPAQLGRSITVRLHRHHLALHGVASMLSDLVSLFGTFTRGKVWACLRELRPDGSYHTILRAGCYIADRAANSKPLHKTRDASITRLRENYKSGSCVMLNGSTLGPDMWTPQPNDEFGEDKCVLMGAVLLKGWNGHEIKPIAMTWVVCVCSDRADAFSHTHLALMQACVDVLSMIVNVLARTATRGETDPAAFTAGADVESERDGSEGKAVPTKHDVGPGADTPS